jgi:hypothetical protein
LLLLYTQSFIELKAGKSAKEAIACFQSLPLHSSLFPNSEGRENTDSRLIRIEKKLDFALKNQANNQSGKLNVVSTAFLPDTNIPNSPCDKKSYAQVAEAAKNLLLQQE